MQLDDVGSPGTAQRPIRFLTSILMVCAVALTQVGCEAGNDGEAEAGAEPEGGVVQMYLTDRTSSPEVPGGATDAETSGPGDLRGSFRGNFIVSVYSEDGFWYDLGRRAEMTLPLGYDSPRALLEEAGVPPGTYSRVRVLVCHSSASVAPGSRVAGSSVEREAHVHLTETGDIYIIRDVEPFRVSPERSVHLDIDLNSPAWITAEAVESGQASIPTFEETVRVRVRGDGP